MRRHIGTVIVVAVLLAACGSTTPSFPPRPATPDGWTVVVSDGKDVRLALPPWMIAWGTEAGIFANEAPIGPGAGFVELMATGARAGDQPGPNDRLEDWLEARLAPAGPGSGSARTIILAAGRGVVIDRVVRSGTPDAWRYAAYAIRTPLGVGYLLLDGPPDLWAEHEADIALIPLLIEFGPGR